MNDVLRQLAELAQALQNINVKPVICGGLAVYLRFYEHRSSQGQMLRITNDIDLMLTESDIMEQAKRNAIAATIYDELHYVVRKNGRCFRFEKAPNQQLDILTPPVKGIPIEGSRVKLIRARLHGRITEEAQFIEEDLRPVSISKLLGDNTDTNDIIVFVPSSTNILILKLFAFDDRFNTSDIERAQAHAWDIYITVQLSQRSDFLLGQELLSRHKDSAVVQRAQKVVTKRFSIIDHEGWQQLLRTNGFYPQLNVKEKMEKLETAKSRLVRWFSI